MMNYELLQPLSLPDEDPVVWFVAPALLLEHGSCSGVVSAVSRRISPNSQTVLDSALKIDLELGKVFTALLLLWP
jgi:hypothetical protein